MSITKEQIKDIAAMARLSIDEDGMDNLAADFDAILNYIDQISSVDVGDISGFQPRVKNIMRPDDSAYESGEFSDDILANAPDTKDGYIKVNKVL